jgi:periplasmic protein TonB
MSLPAQDREDPIAREQAAPEIRPAAKERNPLLRYGIALTLIAVFFGVIAYVFVGHDDMPAPHQIREFTIVKVPPPPPPPPPPPEPPVQEPLDVHGSPEPLPPLLVAGSLPCVHQLAV